MRYLIAFVVMALLSVITALPSFALCYDRDDNGRQTRFQLAEGEATDRRTGLVWQRCSAGRRWDAKLGCAGEVQRFTLDDAQSFATAQGNGWRVPNGAELQSLVDRTCSEPVVDAEVFPDIRPNEEGLAKFWTTSPVGMLDLYYNFDFLTGAADGNSRGIALNLRLVRSAR
ncbi:MAG: hypothetical protein CFE31_18220 [Rhizobiales bacterium PAR1]|nr:MAG: hypothetical protein CFE31_18220 [Rhizobiales bacterium PAR1]